MQRAMEEHPFKYIHESRNVHPWIKQVGTGWDYSTFMKQKATFQETSQHACLELHIGMMPYYNSHF